MAATKSNNNRTEAEQDRCDREHAGMVEDGVRKRGMSDMRNHLAGKRLTLRQAVRARCYQCNGHGGIDECSSVTCPLYPFFNEEE